ncbi:hypothetical protein DUNSADRAFT_16347 [Dunaliella salina]|uniref:Uncharacterized protein n=1 Tax=Dunaliella salina TaxID=3046 RepID=A0ABQ7H125_DUNSA|nr:hypothetical protein DUNSADRAFT_16347 [Dunaliella salina]|eukprot:KAF5840549.1 hypothetical protein DUNSADRAFT_16347 [Dunaliella salina]
MNMLSSTEYARALDELLAFLGETYVEVSGQAEALRTVVADLQSSLAYLHSIPGSSCQGHSPELNPSAVPTPGYADQHSAEQQPLDLPSPAPHAVSPSSAAPPPRLKPTAHRAPPLANAATHPSSARSTPVRSLSNSNRFGRAQATPTSTGAVKRGSARAADPEVGVISREVFESVRGPQPSPALSAPPSAPFANAPLASGPLTRASCASVPPAYALLDSTSRRPGAAASSNTGGVQVAPGIPPTGGVGGGLLPPPPHLPTTPSRPALSLGFKRALAKHQEALQASQALSARDHARTHYLLQHKHLHLQQQQWGQEEGRGQQHVQQQSRDSWEGGMVCAEDAALSGAIDAVGDTAEYFTNSLAAYYGSAGGGSSSAAAAWPAPPCYAPAGGAGVPVSSVGFPASGVGVLASGAGVPVSSTASCQAGAAGVVAGASPSVSGKGSGGDSHGFALQRAVDSRRAGLVHNVDVSHVALVAAHSWLLQAVTKAARQCSSSSGGSGGGSKPGVGGSAAAASGASPTQVLQLLHSLPELQAQLSAWHAELQRVDALLGSGRASATAAAAAAAVAADAGSAISNDPTAVSAASAAAWRNRFLRAVMAGKEHGRGYGVGREVQGVAGGPLAQRSPDALETQSGGCSSAPGSQLRVARPLGIWLPDACFLPLVHAQLNGTSCSSSSSSSNSPSQAHAPATPISSEWAALLAEAPWVLALPTATARAAQASTAGAVLQSAPLLPCTSTLAAPSPTASVSHARSQMQLQLHLMHAWVESQLAAPLLPDPAHVEQCVRLAEQQGLHNSGKIARGSGACLPVPYQPGLHAGLARALAAWRLSHTFLSKNAWNRSAFVVFQHPE